MLCYEIADALGIKAPALSRIFTGRNGYKVGPRMAKRFAAYLGRSDWQKFYHMPGSELRALLRAKTTTE